MLKIVTIFNNQKFEYPVESGMILKHKNPWGKQKYFKIISVGAVKPNGNYYLSCVRSEFPDLFPEFAASCERNGDTGFTIYKGNMGEFELIRLPLKFS